MISGQTTSTDVSSALQNTDTTSSAVGSTSETPSDRTAVLTSINSDSETIEDITKDIPVRVIPSAETDTDEILILKQTQILMTMSVQTLTVNL